MSPQRHFSIDEVNALIPELDALFERIQALDTELGARANELERLGVGPLQPPTDGPPADDIAERQRILAKRTLEFQKELDKIAALGGRVMDFELRIVDFPARRGDEEIFLSWQAGDAGVRYYHRPDEHYIRGRRTLEPDAPLGSPQTSI